MHDVLFSPAQLGDIKIKNRVIMAPMTRSRAFEGGVPGDISATYYAQRAGAGLIITEGTQPSSSGQGYCRTPGIYTQEQIDGWRAVVAKTQEANGSAVMQIMHCGRVGSLHNKDHGGELVAPSAIRAAGSIYSDTQGMVDYDVPRALELSDIPAVINEYAEAARHARACGFEGVELHATSGYLPAQFLSTGTNTRKDAYGGSVSNRIRFVVEVLEAMSAEIGEGRVGMRICPGNPFNDLHDDDPEETFSTLLQAIDPMKLAYLHVIRMPKGPVDNVELAKSRFSGPRIFNDSYTAVEASETIASGDATAISFARDFVANPDLVERLEIGQPLAKFNRKTLYTPGAKGYIDY